MGNRRLELTGQRFGRLTVVGFSHVLIYKGENKNSVWLCLCACGKEVEVRGTLLKRGMTLSCGCYRDDVRTGVPAKDRQSHARKMRDSMNAPGRPQKNQRVKG